MNKVFFENFLNNNLEDKSVDAIAVDPPYNIGYDHWDKKDEDFHMQWLSEANRVLKPGGSIFSHMAFCSKDGEEFLSYEFVKRMKIFFKVDLRNSIIWARQKGRGASKHLKSQREDIFYGYKTDGEKTWNNIKVLREVVTPYVKDGRPRGWFLNDEGERVRWTGLGNIWCYSAPYWLHKTEKQFHSAQKPVMLMERLIRIISNEGDTILDPFIGSGTTAIACKISNRNFIGFENDETIYSKCIERIETFDKYKFDGYNLSLDKDIIYDIKTGKITDKKIINSAKGNIPKEIWESVCI